MISEAQYQDTKSPEADLEQSAEQWVQDHADQLFRVAVARVGDRVTAEDLVQETLMAAWKGRSSFDGRSQLQTWLIAILKRKIVDHFRKQGRLPSLSTDVTGEHDLFDSNGLWKARVKEVPNPLESGVEQEEFWQILGGCLSDLPVPLAQSFHLREMESKTSSEACEELGITRKNLSVRLHRARLLLRSCLEANWLK